MIFDGKSLGLGIQWPDQKRIAVMFTFDFDLMLLRKTHIEGKGQKVNFSDQDRSMYGLYAGLDRCLNMLSEQDVKATFFVPGYIAEHYEEAVRKIDQNGHEIAYHGYMHEAERGVSKETEESYMQKGEMAIEKITGKKPVGHRAPDNLLHPDAISLMQERGYLYSSNMKDCDFAYLHDPQSAHPIVELPTDSIVDDFTYFFFSLCYPAHRVAYTNGEFIGTLKDEFDGLAEEGDKILCIKLHPQLIGRAGRIKALSELIAYMKAHGAYIATCEEVAKYVLSREEEK